LEEEIDEGTTELVFLPAITALANAFMYLANEPV